MTDQKKRFTRKRVLLFLAVVLLVMQGFRIDKTNPEVNPDKDFITINQPPGKIASILKQACYDCHSNTTTYPWYTNIAPVSWWIGHHIEEAREHLNFSEWGSYKKDRADHKLDECYEMVQEGEMPLESYVWMHSEAKLSASDRKELALYFSRMISE